MGWLALWWVWLVVAVLFGALEVMLPTFVFLGFSAGAVATAVVTAFADPGPGWTLMLFALVSAGAYVLLRVVLGSAAGTARIVTRDINDHR